MFLCSAVPTTTAVLVAAGVTVAFLFVLIVLIIFGLLRVKKWSRRRMKTADENIPLEIPSR